MNTVAASTVVRVEAACRARMTSGEPFIPADIARHLGLCDETVKRVLRKAGWWTAEDVHAAICEGRRRALQKLEESGYFDGRRPHKRGDVVARFWRHVQKSDACWEWTASTHAKGYGTFALSSRKVVKAHRFSWELHNGPIPDGLWVLHRCDTPRCVRPDHLFLGTNSDNQRDAAAKLRHNMQRHAHLNGTTKLTPDQVRMIRATYVPFVVTRKQLAEAYGVSESIIKDVVTRKTWRRI